YADFVTAMMAFFLLLWLLNVTTDEQKMGIADYFTPASVSASRSGADGILGGQSLDPEGAKISAGAQTAVVGLGSAAGGGKSTMIDTVLQEREEQKFKEIEESIKEEIEQNQELQTIKENLQIDLTPEGLRIQLVDADDKGMFQSGSARMQEKTRKMLKVIADVINNTTNRIQISGHTDARPFRTRDGYSNWELSSDRAHATRRALVDSGVGEPRIVQVVGRESKEPLKEDEPTHSSNRRISIVLLRDVPALPTVPVDPRQPGAAGKAASEIGKKS
ncbi:MAG: chemotaxis protein MotB, partial [Alphaproteobacteria bacterium]|nr:chemotaxis protein MotB [Alphaproteobacteria bacterium]